jgi:hypothetical protein
MGVNVAIVDPLRLPTVSGGNYLARPGVNELRRYSVGSRNRTTTALISNKDLFDREAESE